MYSHFVVKKICSADAEAILSPSVVPEQKCSTGWTIFQVTHPHSGAEGCRKKQFYSAWWERLAFRHCIQTLEGKKANSASCFSPNLEHGEQAEMQITSGTNKQGQDQPMHPRGTAGSLYTLCSLKGYSRTSVQPESLVLAAFCGTSGVKFGALNILSGSTKC